jgi:hypothetical protein
MTLRARSTSFGLWKIAALCALLAWGRARADEPQPTAQTESQPQTAAPATTAPATTAPAATPRPAAGGSLDFDLFGDQPKPTAATPPGAQLSPARDPAQVAREVKRRRTMLQLHQGFGFATLALMAATLVLGQLNYVDKYGGGDFTENYQLPHLALALATSASFATGAILGLAAPTPYKKPIKADAALLHKVMMGVATAGMVTQLALGFATATQGGELHQRDMALGHLVTGYGTFAAMLTGYLAYVF